MLDVARLAQASKATLYARYENKEALFAALVAWGLGHGGSDLNSSADDNDRDPVAALYRFATAYLTQMLDPPRLSLIRIAIAESGRLPKAGRSLADFVDHQGAAPIRLLAMRVLKDLRIKIDVDEFGQALVALLQSELFMQALRGGVSPNVEEITNLAKRAVDRFMRFCPRFTARKREPKTESALGKAQSLFQSDPNEN